jgi:signal peptidase
MKRAIIILFLLFIYTLFYQTYLIFKGEILIYIVNPLIWIVIAVVGHFSFRNRQRREFNLKDTILSITTILSLVYVIIYYSLGVIVGYTNNPYSTTISGIIINLFSIWLVTCLKEYIRYRLMYINIKKYKKIYYAVILLVFVASDLNFLNIIEFTNFLDLWAKELIIPITINLFMIYLSYIGGYKPLLVGRTITLIPSLLFDIIPDYDWPVIMIFNISYCLITYLILQYVLGQGEKDIPKHLIQTLEPRRWITGFILILLVMAFVFGFFPIKPVAILSGSMKPIINPGDMVIIKKCDITDIKIGDIVQYQVNNYTVVHRVVSIDYDYGQTSLIMKGDANKNVDKEPITSEQVIGKLQYNIPYLGYPAYLLRNIGNNNKGVDIEQGG